MTNFLFWNLYKKPLENLVAELAQEHQVDVLLLAECTAEVKKSLLPLLNHGSTNYFYAPPKISTKVEFFTKFSADFIKTLHEEFLDSLTLRRLVLPGLTDILIAAVHLPSKMSFGNEESQNALCGEISRRIQEIENEIGHSRLILVGDLNMNPFEKGIISAYGLHATMSRQIAQKVSRTILGKKYPFFYNPMWNFFGDGSDFQPGTYYYRSSEPVAYFWNIFDQVLVRPELLSKFVLKDLQILNSVGEHFLLKKSGQPDKGFASDHLPIFFRLEL